MQTLIIGGSRGLGAGMFRQFSKLGPVVVTDSTMDITVVDNQNKLVEMMDDYSIVINNAYAGNAQRDIMLKAFNAYSKDEKIFVNIESINAWREGELSTAQIQYATDKLALVTARRYLQKLQRKMILIGVCPDTIDTEYNKAKTIPKMSVDRVAAIVYNLVQHAVNGVEVSEIHLKASQYTGQG